jgi:exosortase
MPGAFGRVRAWAPAALLTMLAIAYRDIVISGVDALWQSPPSTLLSIPGYDTTLLGFSIALAILWRRRTSLVALPDSPGKGLAPLFLGIAAALLLWSRIVMESDLLLPSLAALLVACTAWYRGREGISRVWVPALVLLLTTPIPSPLEGEWVWVLQKATAVSASSLLNGLGMDVVAEGTRLRTSGFHFDVLEASSGMRLIQILFPVALGLGEAFGLRRERLAWHAIFAVLLGFSLNLTRTAWVIARGTNGDRPDHFDPTLQWIVLIFVGIGVLFLSARLLRSNEPTTAAAISNRSSRSLEPALITALVLALGSLVVHSPFERRADSLPRAELARRVGDWRSSDLAVDYTFPYTTSRTSLQSRVFRLESREPGRARGTVELFVAYESRGLGGADRIPASKLPLPGADWARVTEFAPRSELLGETFTVTEVARNDESELALVYSWRLRDAGLLIESARALSGVDRVAWNQKKPRAAIRVKTALSSQLRSDRRRAIQLLDRFIRDLRPELEAL